MASKLLVSMAGVLGEKGTRLAVQKIMSEVVPADDRYVIRQTAECLYVLMGWDLKLLMKPLPDEVSEFYRSTRH